jgi:hypothetical protein
MMSNKSLNADAGRLPLRGVATRRLNALSDCFPELLDGGFGSFAGLCQRQLPGGLIFSAASGRYLKI